jgi:predicted N-acetyltransferase YhbS
VITIVPIADVEGSAVEALLDHAFGTDRHGRTAYKVREGTAAIPSLSFAALLADGALAGTIQCWPVALACDTGERIAMVMVGPVAVEPEWQQEGFGRALMAHMLDAVAASALPGADSLMLVGDPEYYGRFFGFTADRTAGWRLPGPFDSHRLLARGAGVPGCAGQVGPRILEPA